MDRHEAYRLLSEVLDRYGSIPVSDLKQLVGGRRSERVQTAGGEEFLLDVVVDWNDDQGRALRISAIADSPNTFRLERLEEHLVVSTSAA